VIQEVGTYWMRKRDEVSSFENGLRQLVRILEPHARACICLESSKATAGNVYHNIRATYYCKDNNDVDGLQLPDDIIDEIRKIVNVRWHELTTGPGKSVYVSTSYLIPVGLSFFMTLFDNSHCNFSQVT
jgi:hypothetical protein